MKLFSKLFFILIVSGLSANPIFSLNLTDFGKVESMDNIFQITAKINKLENKSSKSNDEKILLVILYHKYALFKKGIDATEKMISKAEKFNTLLENDQIAKAYYGSMLTLIGRDSSNPVKKIYYAKKGIKKMDNALDMNRNASIVRVVRGLNGMSLPSFFNRKKIASKDLEWIIAKGKLNVKLFSNKTMSEVYFKLANFYKESGKSTKAIQLWEVCSVQYKGTEYAGKSQRMLDIFKD